MESDLIKKSRAFAEAEFKKLAFNDRPFHDIHHTIDVVNAAEEVGRHSELSDDELESVIIAAWLHDVGYSEGAEDHERKAAETAKTLLTSWGASQKTIMEVTEAIMSTKLPQQPRSLLGKVLCDADLFHLSTEACQAKSEMLREEWKKTGIKDLTDTAWLENNLEFLETHQYHTPYGRTVLQQGKRTNIKNLRKLLGQTDQKNYQKLEDEVIKLRSKLEKQKLLKPDRGIETMFRTTSHNHLMLSQMADTKANILITVNSIILSIVVSVLARRIAEDPNLLVPTVILVTVCLSTTIFAILATRPNLTAGRFTRDDIANKKTNLLFFGNFHAMSIEDYEWSMKEMMKDGDYLYGSLIKDIYYLGKVLGRKYKFLRIAYNVFMFGIVVSVLAFIITFMRTH